MGRGDKGRRASGGEDRFWEEPALEVARAGSPDEAVRKRRFTFARRLLKFNAIGFAVVVVVATIGMLAAFTRSPVVPAAYRSDTRAVAQVALQRWLGTNPTPLPGGWVVGWESESAAPGRTSNDNSDPIVAIAVHRFTVADNNGSLYAAEVTVSSSPQAGATVVGTPALVPEPPASNTATAGVSWGDLQSITPGDPLNTAVRSWAEAFLSGDPSRLRQAVGDPDGARSYTPMSGATLASVSIDGAAAWWENADGNHDGLQPPRVLARVTLNYTWGGGGQPAGGNATATMQFDLLVTAADTASPHVVAWGGAGSGQLLSPYGNAVVGRAVVPAATPSVPSSSGTPSSPPSSTPGTTASPTVSPSGVNR